MEQIKMIQATTGLIKKYGFAALILLIGICFMILPDTDRSTNHPVNSDSGMTQQTIDLRLEEILSCIDGAGKVRVFLSEAVGEQTIFQTDEEISSGTASSSSSSQTVIISGSDRTEQGMIVQIIPPRYQGAVIVCQGADRASVRLAIVEAVSNATGLASDRITVLKMK